MEIKRLIVMCLTVFGLMFAGNALAETYRVKSGDILGRIAQKYPGVSVDDIVKANSLKNKNLIRVGQELVIPVPAKGKNKKQKPERKAGDIIAQRTDAPVYYYRYPGRAPVGKNIDPAPIIKKFGVPDSVKEQFIAWAKGSGLDFNGIAYVTRANNPDAGNSRIFSQLHAMGYGKREQIVRNVMAMFDILREAKYWSIDYNGMCYYLICDTSCYNWSYFSGKEILL